MEMDSLNQSGAEGGQGIIMQFDYNLTEGIAQMVVGQSGSGDMLTVVEEVLK